MYLAHSVVLKIATFGFAGTAQFFVSIGLPAFVAYLTIAAEVLGGVLILAGIRVSAVSLALIPILIGATAVHAPNGWVFNANGGGWEYPVCLIAMSVVLAVLAWPAPRTATATGKVATV
jgi:putative oxidoreductase